VRWAARRIARWSCCGRRTQRCADTDSAPNHSAAMANAIDAVGTVRMPCGVVPHAVRCGAAELLRTARHGNAMRSTGVRSPQR
jgi:hypothetical protein